MLPPHAPPSLQNEVVVEDIRPPLCERQVSVSFHVSFDNYLVPEWSSDLSSDANEVESGSRICFNGSDQTDRRFSRPEVRQLQVDGATSSRELNRQPALISL